MKKLIIKKLVEVMDKLYGIRLQESEVIVEIPPDSKMGDYSFPVFFLAKKLKCNPSMIAEEVSALISNHHDEGIACVRPVGGYVNIYINRKYFTIKVLEEVTRPDYGSTNEGYGKTICMVYSSPNIAKNFHVGHLRTTVI